MHVGSSSQVVHTRRHHVHDVHALHLFLFLKFWVLFTGEEIKGQKVIVAPGHSARGMYKHLIDIGAQVAPKPFSVGFRIEHPQDIIDSAQYGPAAPQQVDRGKGKIPVADYKLAANVSEKEVNQVIYQHRLHCTRNIVVSID